jgi:hypothetical protein
LAFASAETGIGEVVFISLFNASAIASSTALDESITASLQLSEDPPDPRIHRASVPRPQSAPPPRGCARNVAATDPCTAVLAALRRVEAAGLRAVAAGRAITTAQNRFGSARRARDVAAEDLQYAVVKTALGLESSALAAQQHAYDRLVGALHAAGIRRILVPVSALRRAGDRTATHPLDALKIFSQAMDFSRLRSQYETMTGFDLGYLVRALASQRALSASLAARLRADADAVARATTAVLRRAAAARFGRDAARAKGLASFLETAARGVVR